MPEMSQQDAAELAARRALDAQVRPKYSGWKPLTVWYAFWCVALVSRGESGRSPASPIIRRVPDPGRCGGLGRLVHEISL